MRYLPAVLLFACTAAEPGDDSDALPTCAAQWVDGVTEPDADGPDTQFHGTSAFDGEHIWMAWNRRDSGSGFDVWLARYGCDGVVDVGPFEVTSSDQLELDPVLAISGDQLLIAWTSDDQVGPNNLDVRYRLYDLDGTAQTEVVELVHTRNGVAVEGNVTQPDIVAFEDGFLLVGSRGHDDATGFQVFGTTIDRSGAPTSSQDAQLDTAFGQTEVAVDASDGSAHLIWQEDSTTSTEPSVSAGVLGEDDGAELATPGARPDLVVGSAGLWQTYDTNGGTVVVRTPAGVVANLTSTGFLHSPSIIASGDAVHVLVMEIVTGVYNRLKVYPVGADGSIGMPTTLLTEGAPSPYGVDLTAVDDTHALVVYQDGPSPNFRLKAEWLEL